MYNRSSQPASCPHAIDDLRQQRIIEPRKQRQTYRHISQSLGIGHSTVARILQRMGLNRLANLEPAPPVQRYEHEKPGDLLHLDIKKLGRFHRPGHRVTGDRRQDSPGAGWEYAHVAVDDHSRVAFSALYPDETGRSTCLALLQALRYYAGLGIRFSRLLTDNGACYRSKRFQKLCRRLGLKHLRTKPYTPQTNGKAERFIQTALSGGVHHITTILNLVPRLPLKLREAKSLDLQGLIYRVATRTVNGDGCYESANLQRGNHTCRTDLRHHLRGFVISSAR
ncbi:transposase InsO family protein [Aeromonas salmonicida]|nr:transposase InsO family protein [Aeromonas salmonicida]